MAQTTVYTIGHSTRTLEELVGLLEAHGVRRLVDVRTVPRSHRYPHFARESLTETLPAAGIEYRWCRELGGLRRPRKDSPNAAWRNGSFRGFADHMQTAEFAAAVEALVELARDLVRIGRADAPDADDWLARAEAIEAAIREFRLHAGTPGRLDDRRLRGMRELHAAIEALAAAIEAAQPSLSEAAQRSRDLARLAPRAAELSRRLRAWIGTLLEPPQARAPGNEGREQDGIASDGDDPLEDEGGPVVLWADVRRLGVALHDLDDPATILKRQDEPVLCPKGPFEEWGDVPNVVYLMALYADGRTAQARIAVAGSSEELQTSALGLAIIEITPKTEKHPLSLQATDRNGITCSRQVTLECGPPTGDFLLRTDKAVYTGGETMQITVIGGGAGGYPETPETEFIVNRPFIFLIRDRVTGTIRLSAASL